MRPLVEATTRWQETTKHSASLSDLQRAVKFNGPSSPCIAGCRSVCWKAFLLGHGSGPSSWSHALLESRSTYASLRDHFLKYIKHPEYLADDNSDPLADDADSPWNTLRQDETLRTEILQDVERLPDEPFYHEPRIQTLILDVLFIYCKLNPDVGGYRQGMHELLAPIVYVVEQDAINPAETASGGAHDLTMLEMLDANFIEHDSFALFAKVMEHAKNFYESGENSGAGQSAIVERSQHIHEVLLYKVDPELSNHLTNIEILPQIFLIRWIRLLFSREFPFEHMLILWDTLFSVDPSLQLVDLVSTAMLVRIRWQLLEADYSIALQLLLKYPPPDAIHGPHTFIDDAVYLRDHLDTKGGSALILKYTGRQPYPTVATSRPSTPKKPFNNHGLQIPRSPTRFPSRFMQQQGGVEALFQGAAKGILERSEKLGVNQAVRDALVEIRRNVHEAKTSMKAGRDLFAESGPNSTAMRAVATMDRRNKQLASMLDESITSLKALARSEKHDEKEYVEALEIATAKIQFVKVYLEDSTMALPDDEQPKSGSASMSPTEPELEVPSDAVAAMVISTPEIGGAKSPIPEDPSAEAPQVPAPAATPSEPAAEHIESVPMDTDDSPSASQTEAPSTQEETVTTTTMADTSAAAATDPLQRPQPIPTRSTLAQSSFAWMLEPDQAGEPKSELEPKKSAKLTKSPNLQNHHKKPSSNANRERTAFLFGEVTPGEDGQAVLPEDIFGLQPMGKNKETRAKLWDD